MGRTIGCGACGASYDADWFCPECGPAPSAGARRCPACRRWYLPELGGCCTDPPYPGLPCGVCERSLGLGPRLTCDRCGQLSHAACAEAGSPCRAGGCPGQRVAAEGRS